MLRKIKTFFAFDEGPFTNQPIVYYFAKGAGTGFTSPSDCVWLVP